MRSRRYEMRRHAAKSATREFELPCDMHDGMPPRVYEREALRSA